MALKSLMFQSVVALINLCLIMASSIQSMDQSCVLSLVVPRDKIKTSCSVDGTVKRRMNTMETKINIYKQQVLELETQIHKERLLNNDKIMSLETMLSKVDKLEEIEKRVSYLENNQRRTVSDFGRNDKQYKFSNEDADMTSDQSLSPMTNWGKFTKPEKNTKSEREVKLLEELENMKRTINDTGKNILNKVEDVLKNVTNTVKLNKTFSNSLEDAIDNETGSTFGEFVPDENNNHIPLQNDQPLKLTKNVSNDTEIGDNLAGNFPDTKMKIENNHIPTGRNTMIVQLEEMLKKEIKDVLNNQIEAVISLVKKQQSVHDTYDEEVDNLSDQHLSDVKYLNDKLTTVELTITSITQTMDDFYSKTVKLQPLPTLFEELKKNLTENSVTKSTGDSQSTIETLDEHAKTLRKMERLAEIFQRSLEHYRNESKATYAELERKISSESNMMKTLRETVVKNVGAIIDTQIAHQNTTIKSQLTEMQSLLTSLEDQNVLMQVDLGTTERKLKTKMSKIDQDLKIAKQDIQSLGFSQGKVQKKQESLEKQVISFQANNDVKKRLDMLELEFKLSLTSDWVEYQFSYDSSRTDCFGQQFIKRTKYKVGRFVGVVLCDKNRYKILLGQNLMDKFLSIGDEGGLGQDHCEYVGSNPNAIVTISNLNKSFKQDKGYIRSNWGDEPRIGLLGFLHHSPFWYECGITIP
ncbi:uncharacterized protein LOC126824439 [Patella vulgata]|uniref:uncharacterized protein LOC126824439 n=1 Tax=Patella vulgata TaxID=6465 RepID=UPI00217F857B|nr:uncharacterized protein LOC126824439 [Patella vulgata]XP_050409624.1 uncharacterized protein LOC126824439 [Patella vulgata]